MLTSYFVQKSIQFNKKYTFFSFSVGVIAMPKKKKKKHDTEMSPTTFVVLIFYRLLKLEKLNANI